MNAKEKDKLLCRAIAAYYDQAISVEQSGFVGEASAIVERNGLYYAVLEDAKGGKPLACYRVRSLGSAYMLKRVKKLPEEAAEDVGYWEEDVEIVEENDKAIVARAIAHFKKGEMASKGIDPMLSTVEEIKGLKYVVLRNKSQWLAVYRVRDLAETNRVALRRLKRVARELKWAINDIVVPAVHHLESPRKYACGML